MAPVLFCYVCYGMFGKKGIKTIFAKKYNPKTKKLYNLFYS